MKKTILLVALAMALIAGSVSSIRPYEASDYWIWSNSLLVINPYNLSYSNSSIAKNGVVTGTGMQIATNSYFNSSKALNHSGASTNNVNFVTTGTDLKYVNNMSTNLTLFYCAIASGIDGYRVVLDSSDWSGKYGITAGYYHSSSDMFISAFFANGSNVDTNYDYGGNENHPHCVTLTYDVTHVNVSLYVNNTFVKSVTPTGAGAKSVGTSVTLLQQGNSATRAFKGSLNYMILIKGKANQTIRNKLWRNGHPYEFSEVSAAAGASDTTPPIFRTNSTNLTSPRINQNVTFSVNASDETALSMIILSLNQTGVWKNMTNSSAISPLKAKNFTKSRQITASKNAVVGYRWWANDTSNNWGKTGIQTLSVANTPVVIPSFLNSSVSVFGNTTNTNFTLNVTSTDADSDTITFMVYGNETGTFALLSSSTKHNFSSGFTSEEANIRLIVNATDGTATSGEGIFDYQIDLVNPLLTTNYTNNSFVKNNTIISFTAQDSNIYNLTAWFEGKQKANSSPTGNELKMGAFTLNITGVSDGNKTLLVNTSDRHTKNELPDLQATYADSTLTFQSTRNPDRQLALEFVYKQGTNPIQKITPAQISNYNIQRITQNNTDRINFGLEANSPNPATNIKFGFGFAKNKSIKLVDVEEHALFHIYGEYWMDFKTYIVNVNTGNRYLLQENYLDLGDYHVIYYSITFADYGLSTGARFQIITESIGGLNIVNREYNVVVDTTKPIISAISPTNGRNLTSGTFVVGFEADDLYTDRAELHTNTSGNWLNAENISSMANATNNFTTIFTKLNEGVYGYVIKAFDLAGNEQVSNNTLTIDVPGTSSSGSGSSSSGGSSYTPQQFQDYCSGYTQQFDSCYYFMPELRACKKGCPEGYSCEDLKCVQVGILGDSGVFLGLGSKTLSIWEKLKLWAVNVFSTQPSSINPHISGISETSPPPSMENSLPQFAADAKAEGIREAAINHPRLAVFLGLLLTGVIALVLASLHFGVMVLLMNPYVLLGLIILIIGLVTTWRLGI